MDFFRRRFDNWIENGIRPRRVDGTGAKGDVRFLVEVRAMARDLSGRKEVVAGRDYVLTEVVHCKSRNNIGVAEARNTCRSRWLRPVLTASGASVVVVLGKHAAAAVRVELDIASDGAHTLVDGRHFVFLGAPGSRQTRKVNRCIPDKSVRGQIRTALSRPGDP